MNIIKKLILLISIIFIVSVVYIKFFSEDISIKPFGIQVFTVQSDSMKPKFSRGDIIIIKEEKEYNIGDVITYQSEEGELITHRIINKNENVIKTKGDNNNTEDEENIKKEKIIGKVIFIYNK